MRNLANNELELEQERIRFEMEKQRIELEMIKKQMAATHRDAHLVDNVAKDARLPNLNPQPDVTKDMAAGASPGQDKKINS